MASGKGMGIVILVIAGIGVAFYFLKGKVGAVVKKKAGRSPAGEEGVVKTVKTPVKFTRTMMRTLPKEDRPWGDTGMTQREWKKQQATKKGLTKFQLALREAAKPGIVKSVKSPQITEAARKKFLEEKKVVVFDTAMMRSQPKSERPWRKKGMTHRAWKTLMRKWEREQRR